MIEWLAGLTLSSKPDSNTLELNRQTMETFWQIWSDTSTIMK